MRKSKFDAMEAAKKNKMYKFYSFIARTRLKLADKVYKFADWLAYN